MNKQRLANNVAKAYPSSLYGSYTGTIKPQFKHDCAKCKFMGRMFVGGPAVNNKRIEADLWLSCEERRPQEYILRLSNEGSDYILTTTLQAYLV